MSQGLPTWHAVPRSREAAAESAWGGLRHRPHVLGPVEVRRRLLHMLPGLLPLLLWVIPHQDPWGPILLWAVALLGGGLVLAAFHHARTFARRDERDWSASVLGYGLPVLGTLLLLPGRAELGMAVLGILAFGDGSATLAGLRLGGRPLPWNAAKTWTGTIAFCVGGSLMGALLFWGEALPRVSPWAAMACVMPATLAAALAESLPVRINDNVRVGVTALAVLLLTDLWMPGA